MLEEWQEVKGIGQKLRDLLKVRHWTQSSLGAPALAVVDLTFGFSFSPFPKTPKEGWGWAQVTCLPTAVLGLGKGVSGPFTSGREASISGKHISTNTRPWGERVSGGRWLNMEQKEENRYPQRLSHQAPRHCVTVTHVLSWLAVSVILRFKCFLVSAGSL